MESCGAAGQGGALLEADPPGQLRLEEVDVWSERGEPVGVERVQQQVSLFRAGIRRGQVDALAHVATSSVDRVVPGHANPASSPATVIPSTATASTTKAPCAPR
jgi:hypothetical protein